MARIIAWVIILFLLVCSETINARMWLTLVL